MARVAGVETVEDLCPALYDEFLIRVLEDVIRGDLHSLLEATGYESDQLLLLTSVPLTGQDFYWGSYGCLLSLHSCISRTA